MNTYLLVHKKYPYQAYVVGSKDHVEEKIKCKKYQKNYYIRERSSWRWN